MKYIDVVIDNNTDATDLCYTYYCDEKALVEGEDTGLSALDLIEVGRKVYIPFGMYNRAAEGYIVKIHDSKPEGFKLKSIKAVDPDICISEEAVNTALWMRNRYLCRYIEAIKCFLPVSEVKKKTKDPFENIEANEKDSIAKELTKEQQNVYEKITDAVVNKRTDTFLLKGVTGSGKTEVYLQSMKKCIDEGRQGIMLVPEISLTPQMVSRFVSRFGKDVLAILHSKLTPTQRAAEYKRIENGSVKIVIGVRSAIFAPLDNIGLIIIDEEHETSYKSDKSPKYDTIEVATKRAMLHKSTIVLGSATPSVVDYYRASKGIFKRIEIRNRYNKVPLPNTHIIDMTKEIKAGNRSLFSRALADAIEDNLEKKKQVILFLNRRGYSSYVSCRECGYVVKCRECGIAMPYHKDSGFCECHYCGRKVRMPKVCPECGSKLIGGYGAGTQQLEEKVKELFPDASADRIDLDSIKKKGELEAILKRFEKGKTDILIGTQIVAKGLDFSNVGLVGVINADTTLNLPDFRSSERTFQLITQAAGRAGRGDEAGDVYIQTYTPDSNVLLSSSKHDYEDFYNDEIEIRRLCGYPPFSDIYQIILLDENFDKLGRYADRCASWLRKMVPEGTDVLGPTAPMLLRQDGMNRYQILIKSVYGNRQHISQIVRKLKEMHESDKDSSKIITVDINPYSFM